MTKLFGASVGRKISVLIAVALLAVVLIVAASVAFFKQIGDIGDIAKSGYTYEVIIYQAIAETNKYATTGDSEALQKLSEKVDQLILLDGSIGALHRYLEQGMSVKAAAAAFVKNYGSLNATEKSAGLLDTLKGHPLREKLVNITDRANTITRKWRDLVRAQAQGADAQRKQDLLALSSSPELLDLLHSFHGALAEISNYFSSFIKRIFLFLSFTILIILATVGWFATKSITVPLKKTVEFAKGMSKGNFSNELTIPNRDELGQMADALNTMTRSLRGMISAVVDGIQRINTSSTELSNISAHLSQGSEQASNKSSDVQTAAEKMSSSMNSIASAMEESSTNTDMVAASAEEMSATINEIAQNAEKARGISDQAATQTSIASSRMNELGEAAQSIGRVIEAITDISEQVNLLALNATIEAARAGEAGKGFAVVANEIKELARQTATATQDIRAQIENIQGTTSATVSQMGTITKVINEVNEIVANIASAVDEQSSATREIANNIGQASSGIREVNENVSRSSELAGTITAEMASVKLMAGEIANSSAQLNLSAEDLTNLSEHLKELAGQFSVN